jgi:hypothetical protein
MADFKYTGLLLSLSEMKSFLGVVKVTYLVTNFGLWPNNSCAGHGKIIKFQPRKTTTPTAHTKQ